MESTPPPAATAPISAPPQDAIEPTPPPGPVSGDKVISWNPGHYFAFKVDARQGEALTSAAAIKNRMASHPVCTDAGNQVKGFVLNYGWFNWEPTLGSKQGENHLQSLLDWSANGGCNGIQRRFHVSIKEKAFGGNGDEVRSRSAPKEVQKHMHIWNRTGTKRWLALPPTWRSSPNPASKAFTATLRRFAEKFGDHPLLESFRFNHESSQGRGVNTDPEWDRKVFIRTQLEHTTMLRREMPRVQVFIGGNGYGVGRELEARDLVQDYADRNAGIGFTWPDTFARREFAAGWTYPVVSLHAILSPHQNRWSLLPGAQNPNGSRFGSPAELYAAATAPVFNPPSCRPERNIPASSECGLHTQYMIWPSDAQKKSGVTGMEPSNLISFLRGKNYAINNTICPTAWTDLGWTCSSGQVVR